VQKDSFLFLPPSFCLRVKIEAILRAIYEGRSERNPNQSRLASISAFGDLAFGSRGKALLLQQALAKAAAAMGDGSLPG
jgi:hypothetical protein